MILPFRSFRSVGFAALVMVGHCCGWASAASCLGPVDEVTVGQQAATSGTLQPGAGRSSESRGAPGVTVGDLCRGSMKPPRRELPEQTECWKSKLVELDDGLLVWRSPEGREFINPGVFGEQLLGLKPGTALTARQVAASRWIKSHAEPLAEGNDAVVWRCYYATNYFDLLLQPPWTGGYAQASIIGGLLALHSSQPEGGWLDLALRAGRAYGVPTEEGGLGERLPNGCLWFEELTNPETAKAGLSPHICNGHIWATLQLMKLARVSGDRLITELANEGSTALKAMLGMFDNGQWIRYDLSPRRYEIRFCLWFNRDSPARGSDGLDGPSIHQIELEYLGTAGSAVRLCVGVDGDDAGAWRVVNGSYGADFGVVPWGAGRLDSEGRGCRSLRDGKSVFVMELPPGAEVGYLAEPFLRLRVWYVDNAASGTLDAMVFSMREQVGNEYARLPGSPQRLLGDGKLRCMEKGVRLCDLEKSSITAWKVLAAYVQPLLELESITGDSFYREWRIRLEEQVEKLKSDYPQLKFGDR